MLTLHILLYTKIITGLLAYLSQLIQFKKSNHIVISLLHCMVWCFTFDRIVFDRNTPGLSHESTGMFLLNACCAFEEYIVDYQATESFGRHAGEVTNEIIVSQSALQFHPKFHPRILCVSDERLSSTKQTCPKMWSKYLQNIIKNKYNKISKQTYQPKYGNIIDLPAK